jgi:hypothetical protein
MVKTIRITDTYNIKIKILCYYHQTNYNNDSMKLEDNYNIITFDINNWKS